MQRLIKNLSTSYLLGEVEKVKKWYGEQQAAFLPNGLVHDVAVECLAHMIRYGDVMPGQRLYEALGGVTTRSERAEAARKNMVKSEALALWFLFMSGKQIKVRGDNWALGDANNKWSAEKFKLTISKDANGDDSISGGEALETPIHVFAPEERDVIRPISAKQFLDGLMNFKNKIGEAFEANANDHDRKDGKTHFIGDFKTTQEFINDVVEYANNLKAKLNPAELGLLQTGNVIQFPEPAGENLPEQEDNTRLIRNGQEVEKQAATG